MRLRLAFAVLLAGCPGTNVGDPCSAATPCPGTLTRRPADGGTAAVSPGVCLAP